MKKTDPVPGFAATVDGVIDVKTVSESEVGAMVNAIATIFNIQMPQVNEEVVRKTWKALTDSPANHESEIDIVPVRVEVFLAS